MVRFVGIGCLIFFINCLNCFWFLVFWIVCKLVFKRVMLNFFKMLVWLSLMVRFRLVCLFRVGKRVLGCFSLIILVNDGIVSGFK